MQSDGSAGKMGLAGAHHWPLAMEPRPMHTDWDPVAFVTHSPLMHCTEVAQGFPLAIVWGAWQKLFTLQAVALHCGRQMLVASAHCPLHCCPNVGIGAHTLLPLQTLAFMHCASTSQSLPFAMVFCTWHTVGAEQPAALHVCAHT